MKHLWLLVLPLCLVLGGGLGWLFWGQPEAENPLIIPLEALPAKTADYGDYVPFSLTAACFTTDYNEVYTALSKAQAAAKEENAGQTARFLLDALNLAGNYDQYYTYKDNLSIEIGNTRYGAYVNPGESPIGGGKGYLQIVQSGDYTVETLEELQDALSKAKPGQVVFLPGDAVIDLTPLKAEAGALVVPAGVTLASNRGAILEDGSVSSGARLELNLLKGRMALTMEENTRLTGITLRGPSDRIHGAHHFRAFSGTRELPADRSIYYLLPFVMGVMMAGDDAEVDNCEISAFNYTGIEVYIGVKNANIHHNYIHHNRGHGLAYGICLHDDSTADIRYNLFNAHRHSIAATGAPKQGYIAAHNVEMGGDVYNSHNFDMHGGADRGDGTDIAGTYCEMFNNTFLADADPYYKRGVPEEYSVFYHNVLIKPLIRYNTSMLTGENLTHYDNVFDMKNPTIVEGERLPGKP